MILELLNSNNECNHSLSNERLWCDYGVINSRRAGPGTAHSPPRPLVHVLQCASAGYLLFLRRLLQS